MWEVKLKNKTYVFFTLDEALFQASCEEEFLTITDGVTEIVGKFGVDSVVDGKCPDGVKYDWNKSSRIGAPKRVKA